MRREIDATGLACPLPVIETKKALKDMSQGQLDVVVDNLIALQNLEKMATKMGLTYNLETIREGKHIIHISVGEAGKTAEEERQVLQGVSGRKVVVLASDRMGAGDSGLGRVLMNSFIYALTELDELPDKVLLYNSGVKLAVTGSNALTDLQKLSSRGVEILNCGTCLNFFGLTEKLAVGSITNMYEIVQAQMDAATIIRP